MSQALKLKDFQHLVEANEPPQIIQLFLWIWLFGGDDPKETAEGVKTLEEAGYAVKWGSLQPDGLRRVGVVVEGLTLIVTATLRNSYYHAVVVALGRA